MPDSGLENFDHTKRLIDISKKAEDKIDVNISNDSNNNGDPVGHTCVRSPYKPHINHVRHRRLKETK